MNDFTSKFSLKEIIEILIPGGYITYTIFPSSLDNTFLFGFLAIAFGIFVSTLPIGQFILSLSKSLCTIRLYSGFYKSNNIIAFWTNRNRKVVIYNYYFRFYDDKNNPYISDLQRNSTELYTGFFNCCCCIATIAFLFFLFSNHHIYIPGYDDSFIKEINVHLLILGISLASSIILFLKVRFLYYRQYLAFKKSPLYKELQEELLLEK